MIKLSDKDMHTDKIVAISLLHFTNNVSKPLKMFLRASNPDEVNLYNVKKCRESTNEYYMNTPINRMDYFINVSLVHSELKI